MNFTLKMRMAGTSLHILLVETFDGCCARKPFKGGDDIVGAALLSCVASVRLSFADRRVQHTNIEE